MERQYRILVLEDEYSLRRALTQALVRHGYRVIAAASPEDGETMLRLVGWSWPDAVISDVNLCREPELRLGYHFYSWWRGRFPIPPFVFMHGFPPSVPPPWGDQSRICHILKPFEPSELLLILQAILLQ